MRAFRVLAFCLAPLFLYACSHPIEIVGQGDVTSASGNRNCYLEDFQAASTKCTKNYAVGAYQETYYAQPRAGWQFDKWVNYCGNATPPNYDCAFNVSADAVALFWGQTAPPLRAEFKTCTPGAVGCGWEVGDMRTFTQSNWGSATTAAGTLLNSNFTSVYGSAVIIGGTFDATFTSAGAVFNYLPATGTAASLTGNAQNPLTTSAGELGGEVLALQLNVDFSAANLLPASVSLGSLRFCNFTDAPSMNGQTVNQLLATANHLLGGGSASLGHSTVAAIARRVNGAFIDSTPSLFAQASLIAGMCPE